MTGRNCYGEAVPAYDYGPDDYPDPWWVPADERVDDDETDVVDPAHNPGSNALYDPTTGVTSADLA